MKHMIYARLTPMMVGVVVLPLAFWTASCGADEAKAPLPITFPSPTLKGTPEDLPNAPNIDKPATKADAIMAPKGVVDVAKGKPVTSSVPPYSGDLPQITDGKKEAIDDDTVEFKKGVQWVQVDLGKSYPISAIALWHDHRYLQVMHCVIVQVSDDADFKTGVTTLFNNDAENLAGQGAGKNREYFETQYGKIIDAKGAKGRYVRGYTKGSTSGGLNAWEELEVYALPE